MTFFIFFLVGIAAQLVDGSIGMGFGMISSTLLVTAGASAALASASVHLAEIGTTMVSGFSHWRENNVDFRLLKRIAIPGAVGAFAGATFLSSIDLSDSKLFISTILFFLGFFLLYKILFPNHVIFYNNEKTIPFIGLAGGFLDAAGGGGWGPVSTPVLMGTTSIEPRKIVGTVNAAEFIVAVSASIGFLINIAKIDFDWAIVGGLAAGGMIIAPIAAKIVAKAPKLVLGIVIAVGIILINGYRIISG
jgi:uncharacterized membrane protein YfcA